MLSKSYQKIYHVISELPVVSTHEHHLPCQFHKDLVLDKVFANSYVNSIANSTKEPNGITDYIPTVRSRRLSYDIPENNVEKRATFLENCRFNTYFIWLEKAIQKIYDIDSEITPQNWEEFSQRISSKHANEGFDLKILTDIANYKRAVNDSYWNYASDLGHPELFSVAMRTDMFIESFHPNIVDHDGNSPFNKYADIPTKSFDDYLEFLRNLFFKWRNNGGVVMKCASAYDRSLNFNISSKDSASVVFLKNPSKVNEIEKKKYGDFMFDWFCKLCKEMDIPFQIHTGLAKLQGSDPLLFEPVIKRYPEIRFVMLHCGYPWYHNTAGLAHNYKNVLLDMTWMPIISTSGAVNALSQFLDVAHSSDRIAWGSDCWTSEEAYGALLAWRHVIALVLSEKIDQEYLSMKNAELIANKLLYKNATSTYNLSI